jgi:hypothetical protein
LLTLLHQAGHSDFRDARGPLGFTQRQAAGKFTRDEVEGFIERLHNEEVDGGPPGGSGSPPPPTRVSAAQKLLQTMPAGELAAELQRRGWTVSEP